VQALALEPDDTTSHRMLNIALCDSLAAGTADKLMSMAITEDARAVQRVEANRSKARSEPDAAGIVSIMSPIQEFNDDRAPDTPSDDLMGTSGISGASGTMAMDESATP
jgi:hypothetical protein